MKTEYLKDQEGMNAVLIMQRFQFVYYLWLAVVAALGIWLTSRSFGGGHIVTGLIVAAIAVLLFVMTVFRYPKMIREWIDSDYENHPDPYRYFNLRMWEYRQAKNSREKGYLIRGELAEAALDMGNLELASEILADMNATYIKPLAAAMASLQKMRFYNMTNAKKRVRQEADVAKQTILSMKDDEPKKALLEAETQIQIDLANNNYTAMLQNAKKLEEAKPCARYQAKAAYYRSIALEGQGRTEEAQENLALAKKLGGRLFG